ncbi:DUF6355 family natural product biosynthesis protein [Amycolatopsis sp. NPDC003676]
MRLSTSLLAAAGIALATIASPAVSHAAPLGAVSLIDSPCGQWKDANTAYYKHCDWNTHVEVRVNYFGGGGYNFCDTQPFVDIPVGPADRVLESVFTGHLC